MRLTRTEPFARTRAFASRLRDCTSGLALTEFAFSLPVLLTLGLFGLETANLAMSHLRISNIAMLTADNAARVRDNIDEADVVELFTGAKMSGASMDFAQNGRIVLSSIEVTPCDNDSNNGPGNSGGYDCDNPGNGGGSGVGPSGDRGQWIRWQRCDGVKRYTSRYGGQDTGRTHNNLKFVGTSANPIWSQVGTAVMLAEVSYDYQPIIPNSFLEGIEIRYESAFNVRQRTDQVIRNAKNITPRTCDRYQA